MVGKVLWVGVRDRRLRRGQHLANREEGEGEQVLLWSKHRNGVLTERGNRSRREQSLFGTLSLTFSGGTACDLIAVSTSWDQTSFQQQEMCHAHQVWSTKPTEAGRNAPMDISGLGVKRVCSGRHLDQWTVQLWTLVSFLTRLLTCRMCSPLWYDIACWPLHYCC